jgi:sialate O-acetylesterase
MKKIILILAIVAFIFPGNAQTKLASIFNDHMVLQRNTEVQVWGTDNANTNITLKGSWGETVKVKTNSKGIWKATIKTTEAGGPYTLKVNGSEIITINDILLGEVWLCGGQSNMSMSLDGGPGQHLENSNNDILNSNNPNLRFITVKKAFSKTPLDSFEGNWEMSQPKTAKEFSAVAYHFGLRLQKYLNVPIGLISSNVGGTPAQAWTPKEIITSKFPEYKKELSEKYSTQTATGLYNGMINPLIPFTIKGTIWYQGEGNTRNPNNYTQLFSEMIGSWRTNWKQGEFPFYFVQIAPFSGRQGENWVKIQQAQLQTMLTVPNTGMTVINDIGSEKRIHPPKKKEVGQRLALWALAKNYGVEGILYSGPVYKSMKIENNKAVINFDYAPTGITSMGKPLTDFEIAGEDGVYLPAKAKIVKKGSFLQVWNDKISNPVHVRYAWKNWVEGSLFNTAGLPASSFTTETWDSIFK